MPTDPCSICQKNVNNNHRSFQCDLCNLWVHIKCNYLNLTDYKHLKKDPLPFFCINCINENLPFTNITDNEIKPLITKGMILPDDETSNIFTPDSPQI